MISDGRMIDRVTDRLRVKLKVEVSRKLRLRDTFAGTGWSPVREVSRKLDLRDTFDCVVWSIDCEVSRKLNLRDMSNRGTIACQRFL